jgi:hypothetical protein
VSNPKLCSVDGCDRPHRAKGMCTTHRYRHDKGLPMEVPVRQYEHDRVCKVDSCDKSREGGDGTYCPMHRRRVDRHGDAGEAARQRAPFGDPDWSKPNTRRRKKLREYGLTVEQYDALLLAQNYRCAICRTDTPGNARTKSDHAFCVDHDHVTGHVRGLLCQGCNRGIGLLKDDPEVIESALKYVRRYRQVPLFGPAVR